MIVSEVRFVFPFVFSTVPTSTVACERSCIEQYSVLIVSEGHAIQEEPWPCVAWSRFREQRLSFGLPVAAVPNTI